MPVGEDQSRQRKCELARLTGRRASDLELVRFFGGARMPE